MKRLEARYNPILIINKFRSDTAFNSIVCRLSKMKLKIPNSIIFLFRLEGGPEVSASGMRKSSKIAAESSCTSEPSSIASGDENSSKLFKYWKTKSTSNEYPIRLFRFPQIEPGWTFALSKIIAEEKKTEKTFRDRSQAVCCGNHGRANLNLLPEIISENHTFSLSA